MLTSPSLHTKIKKRDVSHGPGGAMNIQYKGGSGMKKLLCIVWVMALICAVSFTVVGAQEKKPEAKKDAVVMPDAKEQAEVAKKVELFYEVVSYAEAQKNPLIMVSAVKLLDDISFSGIVKPGQDEKTGAKYDRTGLLKQAKDWAAGDNELLAVIAKVQDPPEQTAVRHHGGPHHGGYYGHGGYWHGGHWRGGYHGRHWGCNWVRMCGPYGCRWACR